MAQHRLAGSGREPLGAGAQRKERPSSPIEMAIEVPEQKWGNQMFNSLDDEIKRDDQATSTPQGRWLRNAAVLLASIVLFGSLYAGIRFLD
jgi:hypothetical protein